METVSDRTGPEKGAAPTFFLTGETEGVLKKETLGALGEGLGQASGGALLDNNANKSSTSARTARYTRRSGLWQVSSLARCRRCGKAVRGASGEVGVRVTEGRAGFAGLVSCGSVWVCPVCSSKIMARRALEIGAVVAVASSRAVPVVFLTLTMRHDRGQRLAQLWDGLAKGWGRATSGRAFDSERQAVGLRGYVRVVEASLGENGWHVHVHALLLGDGLTGASLDPFCESMWRRWSAGLQSVGLDAPLLKGSDWQLVGGDLSGTKLGEYLTKGVDQSMAIGMELTQTQSKVARSTHSTRSVWSLLDEGALDGEVAPLRLWHEWEKGSSGRRQIAWSRGLREEFGLGKVEQSDEEVAAEELGGADDTVVWITRPGWSELVRRPHLIPEVLNIAESQGPAGLSAFLWSAGVDHRRA